MFPKRNSRQFSRTGYSLPQGQSCSFFLYPKNISLWAVVFLLGGWGNSPKVFRKFSKEDMQSMQKIFSFRQRECFVMPLVHVIILLVTRQRTPEPMKKQKNINFTFQKQTLRRCWLS